MAGVGYRERADLPRLGDALLTVPVLLDTNVFIAALTGRGPLVLRQLLANLPQAFVSGATLAELSWTRGRLDPAHPGTAGIAQRFGQAIASIDPFKILVPDAEEWARAGELAGAAARAVQGGGKSIRTAFDRMELINDAVTAIVAQRGDFTIITSDGDFDLFVQLAPGLKVLFYD